MGHFLLALALPLFGTLGTLELATGVEGDTSAGLMAVTPNSSTEPAVNSTLTLLSGIQVVSERTKFTLKYWPRYFYQIPNISDQTLPLFLHRLDTSYTSELTRRTSLRWNANGNVGALNYSSLLQSFPSGTAATGPSTGFIPIATASANSSLSHSLSPLNTMSVNANLAYRTLLHFGIDEEDVQIFPTSINFGLALSDAVQLTERDLVTLNVGGAFIVQDIDNSLPTMTLKTRANNAIANGALTWGHNLSSTSTLSTSAGVALVGLNQSKYRQAFPTFTLGVRDRAIALDTSWISDFMSGVRGYFDPILATFRPQGFMSYGLTGQHGRFWSSQSVLEISAPLAKKPISLNVPRYESSARCFFGLYYQLARGFSANASVQWQLRAGHWSQLNDIVKQNQLTGGIGFRYTLGTDENSGGWL